MRVGDTQGSSSTLSTGQHGKQVEEAVKILKMGTF